ncbi:hypothetical protein MPER_08202, partial [Moniliophthora perniciosa FA553]
SSWRVWMGTMSTELSLGCDGLVQIHFLPGAFVGHDGKAIIIKNVICIHEEDNGRSLEAH